MWTCWLIRCVVEQNSQVLYSQVRQLHPRCPGINLRCHLRIFNERWCMVRFDPCIDYQRTTATPVFIDRLCPDAVDVAGRIAAGECGPQPIAHGPGSEITVINKGDQWQSVELNAIFHLPNEVLSVFDRFRSGKTRCFDCKDTGSDNSWISETVRKVQILRQI